ncbi:unnamed protein product, partial [Ectocarpus sp. 8 AP-2014]
GWWPNEAVAGGGSRRSRPLPPGRERAWSLPSSPRSHTTFFCDAVTCAVGTAEISRVACACLAQFDGDAVVVGFRDMVDKRLLLLLDKSVTTRTLWRPVVGGTARACAVSPAPLAVDLVVVVAVVAVADRPKVGDRCRLILLLRRHGRR